MESMKVKCGGDMSRYNTLTRRQATTMEQINLEPRAHKWLSTFTVSFEKLALTFTKHIMQYGTVDDDHHDGDTSEVGGIMMLTRSEDTPRLIIAHLQNRTGTSCITSLGESNPTG